jgi:hypothetical protein
MKNTIATIALIAATSTSAFAADVSTNVQWTGTVADLENACVFVKNIDGTMTYDDSTRTFFVDVPAVIKVQQRGEATLNIKSGAYIERVNADSVTGHNDYDVQVNYMAGSTPSKVLQSVGASADKVDITADSTMVTASKGGWGADGFATLNVASGWKGLDIELAGKAQLMFADHLIENGDYAIQHEATCVQ